MSYGKEGRTPLQLATELQNFDAIQALLAHGALINASPAYQYGRTALQAATSSSNPDIKTIKFWSKRVPMLTQQLVSAGESRLSKVLLLLAVFRSSNIS